MKSKAIQTVIVSTILIVTSSIVRCQSDNEQINWSQFRGHNSSGIASVEASPPFEFGPVNKKWGHPVSSAVMENKVIINLDYGKEKIRKLLAIDKFSGETSWSKLTYEYPPLKHHNYPEFSIPVRLNNQVIIHKNGGLASFSLDDGQALWWFPFVTNGISSPIVYDDHIYVTAFVELAEGYRGAYFDYDTFDEFLDDFDADKNKKITREEWASTYNWAMTYVEEWWMAHLHGCKDRSYPLPGKNRRYGSLLWFQKQSCQEK